MSIRQRLLATGVTAASTLTVLGTATALALTGTSSALASSPPVAAATTADPTTSTLRELAAHSGVHIGTAVDTAALQTDATYRTTVAEQFSSVTPENVMKWESVEPQRGVNDFAAADQLVAFARAHHQSVRGHTLVWHNQLPAWLTSGTWTPAELKASYASIL
jgi:endo-1,4-beta-xylanase